MSHLNKPQQEMSFDGCSTSHQPEQTMPIQITKLKENKLTRFLSELSVPNIVLDKLKQLEKVEEPVVPMSIFEHEGYIRSKMNNFYYPTEHFFELVNKVTGLLREGYSQKTHSSFSFGTSEQFGTQRSLMISYSPKSGITTSLNKIFAMLPKIIFYEENSLQVNYLHIDASTCTCPSELYKAIIRQFATVLEEERLEAALAISRKNQLLDFVRSMIKTYKLGLLVVDGLQKVDDKLLHKEILPRLKSLTSEYNIPLITTSTPNVIASISSRADKISDIIDFEHFTWDPLQIKRQANGGLTDSSKSQWFNFAEALWRRQELSPTESFTEEKALVLFKNTQSIIGLAKKLFIDSQLTALLSKKDQMTCGLIESVAKKSLLNFSSLIEAIESNDISKISKFEEFMSFEMEELLMKARRRRKSRNKEFSGARVEEKKCLYRLLLSLQYSERVAWQLVERTFLENTSLEWKGILALVLSWENSEESKALKVKGPNSNRRKELTTDEEQHLKDLVDSKWTEEFINPDNLLKSTNHSVS